MREPSESHKQALRYLAAARFYLPVVLKRSPEGLADEHYLQFLHHAEYGLALDELAAIGIANAGFAEESIFWRELELAARKIGLSERAAEFGGRARDAEHAEGAVGD